MSAQPGSLDASFGAGGVATADFQAADAAYAVAVQPDGKVILCGTTYNYDSTQTRIALIRYQADGRPDSSFGVAGKIIAPLAPGSDECAALLLQPDGKIIVAGDNVTSTVSSFNYDFFVARFRPDGQLDTTFGAGKGYVLSSYDYRDFASSCVLQPDGKIVLLGMSDTPHPEVILFRYLPDGTPDPAFGSGGRVVYNGANDDIAASMCLQPDGKIVLGGYRDAWDEDIMLFRFLPNGAPDNSFGTGGISIFNKPGEQRAWLLRLTASGQMLLGGIINIAPDDNDFMLTRFQPNGQPDLSFGQQGYTTIDFQTSGFESPNVLLLQPDGKIIMAGSTYNDADKFDIALTRLLPNGAPDSTFGDHSKAISAFSPYSDYVLDGAWTPDGKIVLAGRTEITDSLFYEQTDFIAARYGTGIMVSAVQPAEAPVVLQVYPNPVRSVFTLEYELQQADRCRLEVVDLQGRVLQTLLNGEERAAGKHLESCQLTAQLPAGQYQLVLSGCHGRRAYGMLILKP